MLAFFCHRKHSILTTFSSVLQFIESVAAWRSLVDGPVTKLTCLCILGNYMVMFNLTGSASPAT